MKKFLFYMGHPAHYHNISRVIEVLQQKGHQVVLVGRQKDVLLDLIRDLPFEKVFLKPRQGDSKLALVRTIIGRQGKMFQLAKKYKPDMMIGTDIVITHIGKLLGIPSMVLNEDDVEEIAFFTNYGIKYATTVLSPQSCDIGKYEAKTLTYPGYHELAYLHPNHFTPSREKIQPIGNTRYFIMRFSSLAAHHDIGRTGITKKIALQIIDRLKPRGKVWITSERPLEPEFEPYRITVHPKEMHHVLYYADLYIGDSQTMTAEAAVLGTPALRFNDFVGRLGYLEELEHRFGLTYGIPTDQPDRLLEKVDELTKSDSTKTAWQEKRERMLQEMIDVGAFWVWFFENYPNSVQEMHSPAFSFDQF